MKNNYDDEVLIKYFLLSPNYISEDVKKEITELYNEQGKEWVLLQLKRLKIVPFGAHVLMELNCDFEYWNEIHQVYFNRNTKVTKVLEEIFVDFNKERISKVCLYENFGVVLKSNSCLACFTSGDVDLTGSYSDKENIDKVLKKHGFLELSRRKSNKFEVMTTYFNPDVLEEGFWVNVLWEPVARRFVLNNKQLKIRLKNARELKNHSNNFRINVLGTDELMYFSLLHIALGHYYLISPGYRLYVDIDRLARNEKINWNKIFKWANEDDMGIRIEVVLAICKDLLDTPIPTEEVDKKKKTKRTQKLLNFLYNKAEKKYHQRSNRIDKVYIELLSDGINPLKAVGKRLLLIKDMGVTRK